MPGQTCTRSVERNSLSPAFSKMKEGKWVKAHCAQYGFIIRYQQKRSGITCYQGEPWHIRCIGREHAAFITELDIPFETNAEYLRLVWQRNNGAGHAPDGDELPDNTLT